MENQENTEIKQTEAKAEKSNNIQIEVNVQKQSQKDKNGITGGLIIGVFFTWLAYQTYKIGLEFPIEKMAFYLLCFIAFLCFAIAASCFSDYKESKKIERLEEENLREEKEFSEIDLGKRALRAEKMFRMNQKQLMRYYDMNLAQTKFLSTLGIGLIVVGMFVVLISLYMYISKGADMPLLFVGSVSGIIMDFIGAVFIKMYTQNIKAAVKFHAKFAESNNLLLANSIANKIEDTEKREDTLSEISKNIILANKNSAE